MMIFNNTRNHGHSPLIVGVIVLLAGCGDQEAPREAEALPVRSVLVGDIAGGSQARYTAEIRSRHESTLSFQVGGKIERRQVDIGDRVAAGDTLATLDATDQELGIDAARAAVAAARAEFDRAQAEEARYRELLERGLTTRAAHLAQQTNLATTQSRLEQATADLRLNEQRLAYTKLGADFDGVITDVLAEIGAVVAPGQGVLRIARPDELEVVFDVPDARIDEVSAGTVIRFAMLADTAVSYGAEIREISPTADPATRTYQVRAAISESTPGLRLGMTVSVELPHSAGNSSFRLPSTALFQSGDAPAVWVVRPDYTLELRPVGVERYESDVVLVISGLAAGERVVTAGVHRLADGERVRLLEESRP